MHLAITPEIIWLSYKLIHGSNQNINKREKMARKLSTTLYTKVSFQSHLLHMGQGIR